MALITCPDCGKRISDRALKCPGCGFSISENLSEEDLNMNAGERSYSLADSTLGPEENVGGVLCSKCGCSVEPGNQYCINCGSMVYYNADYQQTSSGYGHNCGTDGVSEYKDLFFWLAAVVPPTFVIFLTIFQINFVVSFIITWILYAVFIALDARNVNQQQKVISTGFEAISIVLLPPIYIFGRPSKTNKKYAPSIVWIVMSIIVILISFGVIRIGKGVHAELMDYINMDVKEIQQLESDMLYSHDSVIGDNYISDSVVCTTYMNETIPLCQELIEKAEEIGDSIDSEELKAINKLLIKYYESIKKSSEYLMYAAEYGDSNLAIKANDELYKASTYSSEFRTELEELCNKYGVIFYYK